MYAITSWKGQLLLGILVTLLVAGVLSLWPRWKQRGGLTKVAFWHQMQFMEYARKTIIICLVLSGICWLILSSLPTMRTVLLGLFAGILFSIPIGFLQRAVDKKRSAADHEKKRKARAEKAAQVKEKMGIATDRPYDYSVIFLSSAGSDQEMRGQDFVDRRLPESEEPENWIVREFGVSSDHLFVISKYGWSFLGEGESRPYRPDGTDNKRRAIWIQDRYGHQFTFVISEWKPSKQELHEILTFISTYESVRDYRQSYRAREVAMSLRAMKKTTRSSRIARAADILEMSIEELSVMFKDSPSPDITAEILESGTTNNANAA